jgi:hypothetical protein
VARVVRGVHRERGGEPPHSKSGRVELRDDRADSGADEDYGKAVRGGVSADRDTAI